MPVGGQLLRPLPQETGRHRFQLLALIENEVQAPQRFGNDAGQARADGRAHVAAERPTGDRDAQRTADSPRQPARADEIEREDRVERRPPMHPAGGAARGEEPPPVDPGTPDKCRNLKVRRPVDSEARLPSHGRHLTVDPPPRIQTREEPRHVRPGDEDLDGTADLSQDLHAPLVKDAGEAPGCIRIAPRYNEEANAASGQHPERTHAVRRERDDSAHLATPIAGKGP